MLRWDLDFVLERHCHYWNKEFKFHLKSKLTQCSLAFRFGSRLISSINESSSVIYHQQKS